VQLNRQAVICAKNTVVNSEIFELVPLLHIIISVFCFKVSYVLFKNKR
jgi:hypothetical protein